MVVQKLLLSLSFLVLLALGVVVVIQEQELQGLQSGEPIQHSSHIVPGDQAPEFKLVGLDGLEHQLQDYKGKFLLINFWATWCAPCVAEMPALERLYQSYKEQGLVVIAIAGEPESAREKIAEFVHSRGLTFPVLIDADMDAAQAFGLSGFPETFFVDASGRFVAVTDPVSKKSSPKWISDRPWDSPRYMEVMKELLEQKRDS